MGSTVDDLPELDVLSEAFLADPDPAVRAARDRHWAARSFRGVEVLSYEGCAAVLQNDDFGAAIGRMLTMMGIDITMLAGPGRNLLVSEGEEHLELRRVVAKWFTPRRVEQLHDRVAALIAELLGPVTADGGGDLMEAVARRIPGRVFCWMIGADDSEGDRLYALSERLIRAFAGNPDDAADITAAGSEMIDFVDELVAAKRTDPGDDLATILLAAHGEGTLALDDVRSLCFELLTASTDNTANSTGLLVSLLAAHPDQWAVVRDDPAHIATAVEEAARVDPVVRVGSGYCETGTVLLDLEIPAGTYAWNQLVAAHSDPAVYVDPLTFDVTRVHPRPHLNFGTGRHFCLGAALARMELRALVEVLVGAWRSFEIGEDAAIERSFSARVLTLPTSCQPV